MAQYIELDALVAEIKGLIRANELYLSEPKTDEIRFQKVGAYSVLNDLLHFLDTLEVKEVKEELVNKDLEEAIGQSFNWKPSDEQMIKIPIDSFAFETNYYLQELYKDLMKLREE